MAINVEQLLTSILKVAVDVVEFKGEQAMRLMEHKVVKLNLIN